jgi:serine protease Do
MINDLIKKKNIGIYAFIVGSILCLLAGAGISGAIERYSTAGRIVPVGTAETPPVTQGLPDFASLAKRVGPSVVNVSTTQIRKAAQGGPSPFDDDDPMSQFWQRFFGGRGPRGPQGPQRQNGLGSGFIIDRNGTILTNYHVVDSAQKISVTLSDGKSYDAKVIGKDQKTDIAVIKIDAGQDLPVVTLGDSDRLEVGEWVMAIGNPFGLDHTVKSAPVLTTTSSKPTRRLIRATRADR